MSLSNPLIVPAILLNIVIITARNLPNLNPCTNKTITDAIIEKCPFVANNSKFSSQRLLNDCSNWCEINSTKDLTRRNENEVLCLLYYDTFIPFCTDIMKISAENIAILVPSLKNDKVNTLCSNLSIFPNNKTLEHNLKQIITSPRTCEKLCTNYDSTIEERCSLAYYFSTFDLTILFTKFEVTTLHINDQIKDTGKNVLPSKKKVQLESNDLGVAEKNNQQNKTSFTMNVKQNVEGNSKSIQNLVHPVLETAVHGPIIQDASPSQVPNFLSPNQNDPDNTGPKVAPDIKEPPGNNQHKNLPETSSKKDKFPNTSLPKTVTNKTVSHVEPDKVENIPGNVGKTPVKANVPESGIKDVKENHNINENEENGDDQDNAEWGLNNPVDDGDEEGKPLVAVGKNEKPVTLDGEPANYNNTEELDGESYFFSYFMVVCVLFVMGYVVYHNRQKILALVLEGKRGKRQYRGRRPNSANYHKLDSNLEEAISSSCTKNSSHVIY